MIPFTVFDLYLFVVGFAFVKGSVLSVSVSNTIEVIDGSSVEIHCETGGGERYFKWYVSKQATVSVNDLPISICMEQRCTPSSFQEKYSFTYSGSDLYVNILNVNNTDEKYWICADGSDSSISQSLFLYVKVPVTSVSMDLRSSLKVEVKIPYTISCSTSYGRPAADVKFYREINGHTNEITQNLHTTYNGSGNGVTVGTITYTSPSSDGGARIYCLANNTITRDSVKSTTHLTVALKEAEEVSSISPLIGSVAGAGSAVCVTVIVVVVFVVCLRRRTTENLNRQQGDRRRDPNGNDDEYYETVGEDNTGNETHYSIDRRNRNGKDGDCYKTQGDDTRGNDTYYSIDRGDQNGSDEYEETGDLAGAGRKTCDKDSGIRSSIKRGLTEQVQTGQADEPFLAADEDECRLPTDEKYENLRLSPIKKKALSPM